MAVIKPHRSPLSTSFEQQRDQQEQAMATTRLLGPTAEPCTVNELKSYLRVTHDAEDALIASLIAAARAQVETTTRRVLLSQQWRLTLDQWPDQRRILCRLGPLRAVLAARVFDHAGAAQELDVTGFVVDRAADRIVTPPALPQPGRACAGIELDCELGFGSEAADVPEPLRQAVRSLAAHWYDQRGVIAEGSAAPLPAGLATLLGSARGLSL